MKTTRKCKTCKQVFDVSEFLSGESTKGHDYRLCLKCRTYKFCNECKEYKIIDEEISYKGFFCFECIKKKRRARVTARKKISWERICPNCNAKVITTKPRATIVYCEDCKEKKRQLRREKKIRRINRKTYDYCQICETKTENSLKKHRTITCNNCRPMMNEFKKSCCKDGKYYKICLECNQKFEVPKHRFWNALSCLQCRKPSKQYDNNCLHQFGYKGVCSDGHRFESLHEMDFDEWLIERKIKHVSHPRLKPYYNHSDYYLLDYNIHIEIDGMEREDDVDWFGKLTIYKNLGIEPLIVKPVTKHFIEDKETCFRELDQKVLSLLGFGTQTGKGFN